MTLLPIDHVFFAVLVVFFPAWAALFSARRLKRAAEIDLPRVRLSLYRRAMLIQWTLFTLLLAFWAWARREPSALGLVPHLTPGLIGILVGLVIAVVAVVHQRNRALVDDDALHAIRGRLGRLERLLPRREIELRWFYALSVTAGVCEELLYRGFLVWYLAHWVGLLPAAGIAAVCFGIGHSYQGPRGMLLTGAAGVFLGAVYVLSGSLYAGMIVHALMDIHSGHLGYVALNHAPSSAWTEDPATQAAVESDLEAAVPPDRESSSS